MTCWLPPTPLLHLDAWHTDVTAAQRTLPRTSPQALGQCPLCRFPTRRVQSRSGRTVADLLWGAWRVVLHLQVRKVCCAHGPCTRRILTARLAPRVAPWARRTQRLVRVVAALAEGLGVRAVARVFAVDPNTVLAWLVEAANHLEAFSRSVLHDVQVSQVQLDELYAVLSAVKASQMPEAEAIRHLERSPQWVW